MKASKIFKTLAMVVGVVAMFGIVVCADNAASPTDKEPVPNTPKQWTLNGTAWKLNGIKRLSLGEVDFRELEPKDCERCYTLIFDTDTSYRGHSFVNDFLGKYKSDYVNHTIQMGIAFRTKVGSNNKDNDLYEGLMFMGTITSFIMVWCGEGEYCIKQLILYDKEKQNCLLFYPDNSPRQTLKGVKWKLLGIGGPGKTDFRELEPKDCEKCYTLTFDTDSTFRGFSQVNELFGEYWVDNIDPYSYRNMGSIRILRFGGTKIGGTSDNKLFERPFWEKNVTSFTMTKNELWLYDEKNQNYLVFQRN